MTNSFTMGPGRPAPLGATVIGDIVNFAIFSAHATRMTVCFFSDDGKREIARFDLPEREGGIWFGAISGVRPGQKYGYRADGPYAPHEGHRFNANKLLIDPYARRLTGSPRYSPRLLGYRGRGARADLGFDTRDSAPDMPKCIVDDPPARRGRPPRPATPLAETIIYEAHAKGLTQMLPGVDRPGSYLALASDQVLDHLLGLGVTAIELLPIHAFMDDGFLVKRGLRNYWGYQSICFFAPEPRYARDTATVEFRAMVDRLHRAGIEVLLDVVYNHTGEGNEFGPTLSFRGLDNKSYYRLADDPRRYIDDTGTGNTLNIDHPMVLRLVLDSLRYWVTEMGVDGFRFDLCSTLGRTPAGFDRNSPFFKAVRQDPVLSQVKLIAEPWDIGPGGYQLGAYPVPFLEWNDKFRDGVRRFWRGDPHMTAELAQRISGSAMQFDHSDRASTSSVNFLTAHDGFTLQDVVSFNERHNLDNGEGNRDGHGENYSGNLGVEGPTGDPDVTAARARRKRNLMATLLLSQGTPMLLAGDEIGNSQNGNNNAYCQDNATGWINWETPDIGFLAFVRRLIAFRKAHPMVRQRFFLHGRERAVDGKEDLFWWRADGTPMTDADWSDPALALLCVELRTASVTPAYEEREEAVFAVFNGGDAVEVTLPECPAHRVWRLHIDTARPHAPVETVRGPAFAIPAQSVLVFVLEANGG